MLTGKMVRVRVTKDRVLPRYLFGSLRRDLLGLVWLPGAAAARTSLGGAIRPERYIALVTWPRISPAGFLAVWTFT